MTRHAFKMKLKPGVAAEYQKRHDEIWPELLAALRAAGVSDYSIFLDEATLTRPKRWTLVPSALVFIYWYRLTPSSPNLFWQQTIPDQRQGIARFLSHAKNHPKFISQEFPG